MHECYGQKNKSINVVFFCSSLLSHLHIQTNVFVKDHIPCLMPDGDIKKGQYLPKMVATLAERILGGNLCGGDCR